MRLTTRLALFCAVLAVTFAAAFGVGRAWGPLEGSTSTKDHGSAQDTATAPPGLVSADGELALVTPVDIVPADTPTRYSFQIRDADGAITDFDLEQTKRMHLIVVRRDFVGFVHDHPAMDATGTWSTTLTLPEPGPYRVFADFIVDGDKKTLGSDLFVPGDFEPAAAPRPASKASAGDGYDVEVELADEITAGEESELAFVVRNHGRRVARVDDYLGAKGHLVALRNGDLAYLHVHPEENRLVFEATFPTSGDYRLFLQFRDGGRVRTVSFTLTAREAST